MSDLELRFAETIDHLDLPEVDFVDAVLADLETNNGDDSDDADHRSHSSSGSLRWLAAAALLVVVASAALLAITPTRSALADWLGIGATELQVEPEAQVEFELEQIDESTLDVLTGATVEPTVQSVLDPLPTLGPPAEVITEETGARLFVWEPTADLPAIGDSNVGALLRVRETDSARVLFDAKTTALGDFDYPTIKTENGPTLALVIDAPHLLQPAPILGGVRAEPVIIWVIDGRQYRIEASADRATLIQLAESVRVGTDLLQPG